MIIKTRTFKDSLQFFSPKTLARMLVDITDCAEHIGSDDVSGDLSDEILQFVYFGGTQTQGEKDAFAASQAKLIAMRPDSEIKRAKQFYGNYG